MQDDNRNTHDDNRICKMITVVWMIECHNMKDDNRNIKDDNRNIKDDNRIWKMITVIWKMTTVIWKMICHICTHDTPFMNDDNRGRHDDTTDM